MGGLRWCLACPRAAPSPLGTPGGWARVVPRTPKNRARCPPPIPPNPQKMLQCPYFFFDVVYIHNGAEEKEDETSWKVSAGRGREGMEGGGQ